MRLVSIALITTLSITAACKKDDKKPEEGAPAAKTEEKAKQAAPAGPKEMTAEAFVTDFLGEKDGMALLDRYRDGIVVTGNVKQTIEEMDGSLAVWLDAGNPKYVSLGFKDQGAAAKSKGLKQGDPVKARCQVGGGMDNYVMVTDCELL
jgi:hypothetical protein